MPVSVILPCFNEEAAVASGVNTIRSVLAEQGIQHEIIVVDDGSTDGTAAAAMRAQARVLQHHRNRGYGASIKTGMLAAKYDAIVISDADGTYPAEAIPDLLQQLKVADMVVGSRTGNDVHIPWERRPAKWFITQLAAVIAGQRIPDLNSGLRAFWRDPVKQYFHILSNKFSFTTTSTLALLADDYRVLYIPIDYRKRIGKSKITPRNFTDFIMLILRISMMFQPLRLFLPMAFVLLGLGCAKTIFDVWSLFVRNLHFDWALLFYPVLSVSAMLLILTGLQVLFIGMLADAMVRRIGRQDVRLPSHGLTTYEMTNGSVAGAPELTHVANGRTTSPTAPHSTGD